MPDRQADRAIDGATTELVFARDALRIAIATERNWAADPRRPLEFMRARPACAWSGRIAEVSWAFGAATAPYVPDAMASNGTQATGPPAWLCPNYLGARPLWIWWHAGRHWSSRSRGGAGWSRDA